LNDYVRALAPLSSGDVAAGGNFITDGVTIVPYIARLGCVPLCPADYNADGLIDFFDYEEFAACFVGGACGSGRDADFNTDGSLDFFDYNDFVIAFEVGC
jgi:hypothetical protein